MAWLRAFKGRLVPGLLVGWAVMAGGAPPAIGSIMRFLSVEELADSSPLVVRARIMGQSTHWTTDREGIYTRIEATVIADAGSAPGRGRHPGEHIEIIQAGGVIDGVSLDWNGRPTFRTGEDLVLFLAPYDDGNPADSRLLIVGGRQGRMRVVAGSPGGSPAAVERDLKGVLGAPRISGDVPEGPGHRQDLIPYDELLQRVSARRRPR